MSGKSASTSIRYIRVQNPNDELSYHPAAAEAGVSLIDLEVGGKDYNYHNEQDSGVLDSPTLGEVFLRNPGSDIAFTQPILSQKTHWTRRRRIPLLGRWLGWPRRSSITALQTSAHKGPRTRLFRLVIKGLAVALMLLGLIEFVVLLTGLLTIFLPDTYESFRPKHPSSWPTDVTADIQPYRCHSHNDYWRHVPLKSAIRAGCTGVEADVWLFPDQPTDLFVGHSTSSLISERTFKNLYIDPLVQILERQNPKTTFHPQLDSPRNGVFDVDSTQSLVLLIDFKTDGPTLWPKVSEQLEPLRSRNYLTHFNGTAVVNGPVTIVVTGNAPFNKVVENPKYRDMFFDAPLETLGGLTDGSDEIHSASHLEGLNGWPAFDDYEERAYLDSYTTSKSNTDIGKPSNQGQGHSGSAPKNAAIYTPANSYYASVSFAKSIGPLFPFPHLTKKQEAKIRQQIAGAHKQGLKVRYWNTPEWPIGMREYVWRVLVEEGVDYLNVDDLRAATKGRWADPQSRRHRLGLDWSIWDRF